MAREEVSAFRFRQQYEVQSFKPIQEFRGGEPIQPIHRVTFHRNNIELSDAFMQGLFDEADRKQGSVTTKINGVDYSLPSTVEIRPFFHDANRYHLWISLGELRERTSGKSRLVVTQRIVEETEATSLREWKEKLRFRALFVDSDGTVREETFPFLQRGAPVYRAVLANSVSPSPSGFHSDVYWVWPSLFYPVLYPWFSGALGAFLVMIGLLLAWTSQPRSG